MTTHVIQTWAYVGKLLDLWMYLDYAMSGMNDPALKAVVLSRWMEGIPEMLRDEQYVDKAAVTPEVFEQFVSGAEERIRAGYVKKLEDSQRTVLNLHLVMMCTTLELYFEHVFMILFRAQRGTLLALSSDKTITLKEFMDSGSYEKVDELFVSRTTDRILRAGTKEVLRSFAKIGIETSTIFSWSTFNEKIKEQFATWNDANLHSVFEERHSIVHDNVMPISNVGDLRMRRVFFQNIVLNIGRQCWKKFHSHGVILDMHDDLRKAIAASGGDPNTYPPPPKGDALL